MGLDAPYKVQGLKQVLLMVIQTEFFFFKENDLELRKQFIIDVCRPAPEGQGRITGFGLDKIEPVYS